MKTKPNWAHHLLHFLTLSLLLSPTSPQSDDDTSVLRDLKKALDPPNWSDPDPCKWAKVQCSSSNRVTKIQLGNLNLSGSLPLSISNLASLETLELMNNKISGPLPSLSSLKSLTTLLLNDNQFTFIPPDFFATSLQKVYLDKNPFSSWVIPDTVKSLSQLRSFSANSANVTGTIPDFFRDIVGLTELHLAHNNLVGGLPDTLGKPPVQSLWVNGNGLNGSVAVLGEMVQLTEVWLNKNFLTGPLPDLSGLTGLRDFNVRDNEFTGPVPESLIGLTTLNVLNFSNNFFQGPTPKFHGNVSAELTGINRFCRPEPGVPCDSRVSTLLSIVEGFGYPKDLADAWEGNDPCSPESWLGVVCRNGDIIGINLPKRGLSGTISPSFANFTSLEKINLSNNNITGKIPQELANLKNLKTLDVSNNRLSGKVPEFGTTVLIDTGNPDIGKDVPSPPPPGGNSGGDSGGGSSSGDSKGGSGGSKKNSTGAVIGSVVGGVSAICAVGVGVFCLYTRKRKRSGRAQTPNTMVVHPRHSGSDQDAVKITIANGSNVAMSDTYTHSHASSGSRDVHIIEAGTMVISIQVLRNVTNNFSDENILGRGGFGTVYKGELHDGTKIAVKRMESSVITEKGLDEFKSEIAVLTKVRHRHLVALLGYCLEGNERLLVYEYMPQGTLSRFLFNWREEDFKPLEWSKRLTIALDVARGVEYLHGLAHQSFIHRDLKPSNILLGDDMRAKVADFGLVRLAPDGKASVVTRLAGTFGYLAPEYAVTGRVTTKIDVFSFGVILMELITGRKALDESRQEESVHLVTWFRRMHINKETFREAIDPTIELDEETLASVSTVAELAGHCSAREPTQRPDMGHVVNVISSLAEMWKPGTGPESEDVLGIDFDMTLPQALKKWQALEGDDSSCSTSTSFLASGDNTQTSLPNRPSGFAESFTSVDGR